MVRSPSQKGLLKAVGGCICDCCEKSVQIVVLEFESTLSNPPVLVLWDSDWDWFLRSGASMLSLEDNLGVLN